MVQRLKSRSARHAGRIWGVAVLVAAAIGAATTAWAETASTTFTVNATVESNCTISATDLNFGIYDPNAGSPSDTSSTLSVLCTNGTSYTVSLDAGAASGSTVTDRHMASGSGDELGYALYTDAGHTTLWGDGSTGTSTVPGTGSGVSQSLTVYGEIPTGQTVPAGTYADSVTATLTY